VVHAGEQLTTRGHDLNGFLLLALIAEEARMSSDNTRLVRDPVGMTAIAEATESEDIFGSRHFPVVYFPNTATVGQMMKALYWPKSYETPRVSRDGQGITMKCRIKPEYIPPFISDTLEAGGAFVADKKC
jgi:hypothetical protein